MVNGTIKHEIFFYAKINHDRRKWYPIFVSELVYFPMDNNFNEVIQGLNGVVDGATQQESRIEKGYYFDGVNDTVTGSTITGLNGNTSSTWCYWGKLEDSTDTWAAIFTGNENAVNTMLLAHDDGASAKRLSFCVRGGSCAYTTTAFTVSEWFFFSGTYDRINLKAYFNGIHQGTQANAGVTFAGANYRFGCLDVAKNQKIKGVIDEFMIFDKVLTDNQIKSLYNMGF